jgi:CheY-like chemotaxis protein
MPNLLIIEDNLVLQESLRIALEGPEYDVRCAASAEQGMLFLMNWKIDVVIVDYMLPGMNGLELMKRITQINNADYADGPLTLPSPQRGEGNIIRKPKIILLSARMDRELEERARAAGADWCLAKPFDLDVLRRIVGD